MKQNQALSRMQVTIFKDIFNHLLAEHLVYKHKLLLNPGNVAVINIAIYRFVVSHVILSKRLDERNSVRNKVNQFQWLIDGVSISMTARCTIIR